ncbi:MAG: methyl-accepting chemotaxis protein [Helicobacteraceae bacterium]|jgi:methyl-accepting chemotaxis protein|nr:methyl-accepting chemotaxis protein [Helicobacteraceae bacterium]
MVRKVSVGVRLIILALAGLASIFAVGAFGFYGVATMSRQSDVMYSSVTLPATELGAVNGVLGKIVADILLAFQHDPNSRFAVLHADHGVEVHIDSMEDWRKRFERSWEAYKKTDLSDKEQELSRTIETNYKAFIDDIYKPILAKLRANQFSVDMNAQLLEGFKKHAEVVEHTLSDLIALQEDAAEQINNDAREVYSETRTGMIIVVVISLGLMGAIAYVIAASITGPLATIQAMTGEIERTGDFRKRIQVRAEDEVGKTGNIINNLIDSLQSAFSALLKNTQQLDKASAELAQLSGRVAKASEKTSDSSSDMAASVEEMTASITQVGENAKETSKNAQSVMELSQSGAGIVNKTVAEMQNMSQAVQSSSQTIAELGKQSEQISGIVQTIKDVADQTNLLALNAAIEAARAGEQGRGFAVVADEIRKLAERTTSATTEIAAMISAIQESAHTAVASMTHAATMVSEGVSLAEQAGEAIDKIAQGASQAQVRVADITAALSEQSSASHQIAEQVERVAQATDENSEAAKSSSAAADNIAKLAATMREAMSKFQV